MRIVAHHCICEQSFVYNKKLLHCKLIRLNFLTYLFFSVLVCIIIGQSMSNGPMVNTLPLKSCSNCNGFVLYMLHGSAVQLGSVLWTCLCDSIVYCLAVIRRLLLWNNATAFDAKWTCFCDTSQLGVVSCEGQKCVCVSAAIKT